MAGKEKRRYINYRVDAYLRDRFLQSGRKHKPRELCGLCGGGESLMRCFNHIKFCIVCCASLSQAVAPWMLCALEVLSVLLIYFLATSRSLVIHHHRFSFTRSLEDIVGLSCTRAAVLSLAYAVGQRSVHRPYLYAAYLLAAACIPYIVVKTILFRYGHDSVAAASILVISGLCSVFHVLAARRTVDWARRRYQMGLAGFGMPWEEGEDAWLMMRRPDLEDVTKTSDGGGPDASEDVPAEMLADDDSKFVELEPGLKVHYKEVAPPAASSSFGGGPDSATTGIVLVHGFGGGVFSWRHIMEALAMQCHCRVVAFDRPAFGLTSRPKASEHSNPYTVPAQSQLLLQLCSALRLRQVVLMAHADGCLVTLRAAATSASFYQQHGIYMNPQQVAAPQHPMYDVPQSLLTSSSGAVKAPERVRTAPGSADSSPRLASDASGSPSTEQQLVAYQPQQPQQGQVAIPSGLSPAPSCGSGALSAAVLAAAAAGEPATGGAAHQLATAASLTGSLADQEMCRSVVAAEEAARGGPTAYIGGFAQGGAAGKAPLHVAGGTTGAHHQHASMGGALHHQHHHHHHHTHSFCAMGSGGCAALDLEAGSARCDTLEMDQAAATSISFTTALSGAHHRRAQSVPGPVGAGTGAATRASDIWETASCCSSGPFSHHPTAMPVVLGLVLLHPNLSGVMGPAFFRILARSKLGRSILRPLLRTEVGEVANRRAWHNTDKLTTEILELYKTPLRVEGWDAALIETTRQRRESCQGDLPAYCNSIESIPTLIATGEHDRIVPPSKSESLGTDLPHAHLAVLHDCGHLSHEEAPSALLEHLVPFCGEILSSAGSYTAGASLAPAAPSAAVCGYSRG